MLAVVQPSAWCAVSVICLLLCVSSWGYDVSDQNLDEAEARNLQDMLKHQIAEAEKGRGRRGRKVEVNDTVRDEKTLHPYMKTGVVKDVLKQYGNFREMILVKKGAFWMGTNDPRSTTGEYPLHSVVVSSFYLDKYPVTNSIFWAYRKVKRFARTEAEKKGWSWVVDLFLSEDTRKYYSVPGARGWAAVKKAQYENPEGPDSNLDNRWTHPVVHVSWEDAKHFCEFHGKRLPTEAEWEYAAKIGVTGHAYPWGDRWERKRANVWQGKWPDENKMVDGYKLTSPVDAFRPQNIAGFYDLIGNVWEWTSSAFVERSYQRDQKKQAMMVLKGGSFVDSVTGEANYVVRNGQRMGQKQDYTAANVGFRCALSAPEVDEEMLKKARPPPTTTAAPKKRKRRFFRKKRDEL